ncbi:ATP-binding protein [Streptomyces sp. NPDC101151]|uniref:ATP-binding protein n=1 Tax=Streptomyces sp. NPDC101151 TaxID=3366115 RepID=UPI003818DED9
MDDTLVAVETYAEDATLVKDDTLLQAVSGRAEIWIERGHASLSHARAACRFFAANFGWPSGAQEGLTLVVSELVTNACRYSSGPCRMNLEVSEGEAVVEVWDSDPCIPTLPAAFEDPSDEAAPACSGYGLGIVASLADSLDFLPQEIGGKIVRAVVLP